MGGAEHPLLTSIHLPGSGFTYCRLALFILPGITYIYIIYKLMVNTYKIWLGCVARAQHSILLFI